MDVQVRAAREDELDEIGALTAEVYTREEMADEQYLAVVRDARSRWESPATAVLVALDGGTEGVLGAVVYAAPGSPWQDLAASDDEAEFRMLAVRESARGRGVGEALVRACADKARQDGAAWLVLSTGPQSKAAHRLYERLGFQRAPERDWAPRENVDTMLAAYVLPLRNGAA